MFLRYLPIILTSLLLLLLLGFIAFVFNLPVVQEDPDGNCVKVFQPIEDGKEPKYSCDFLPKKYVRENVGYVNNE